jgi:agmatinase
MFNQPSYLLMAKSDTWKPKVFGGAPSTQAAINHGTYFYHAHAEGLLGNDSNIHAGIRTTLSGPSDYENDGYCGFEIVEAREVDTIGTAGIIKKIRDRVGTKKPVYLSIDIDTLDPACKFHHLPFRQGIVDILLDASFISKPDS